jgi:hypothetical protein
MAGSDKVEVLGYLCSAFKHKPRDWTFEDRNAKLADALEAQVEGNTVQVDTKRPGREEYMLKVTAKGPEDRVSELHQKLIEGVTFEWMGKPAQLRVGAENEAKLALRAEEETLKERKQGQDAADIGKKFFITKLLTTTTHEELRGVAEDFCMQGTLEICGVKPPEEDAPAGRLSLGYLRYTDTGDAQHATKATNLQRALINAKLVKGVPTVKCCFSVELI